MAKFSNYFSYKSFFIAVFVLSVLTLVLMLFPEIGSVLGPNILFLWSLLIISGAGLVVATYKEKPETRKLRFFLLLTGYSAAGFVLGVVLHNAFYALAMLAADIPALPAVLNILEVGFFLVAVILCPLGLLVGLIGTIVMWKKFIS